MTYPGDQLPRYDELPVRDGAPARSSWGVFGDDDQVGTINLLGPAEVLNAARLVRQGKVFSLNWDLELPDPPLSGRRALKHTIHRDAVGTDDYYDCFYTQRSSQWDALCHIRHPEYGFYNGCPPEQVTGKPGSRNGIDNWARRGIAGRFILADIGRAREQAAGRWIRRRPRGSPRRRSRPFCRRAACHRARATSCCSGPAGSAGTRRPAPRIAATLPGHRER